MRSGDPSLTGYYAESRAVYMTVVCPARGLSRVLKSLLNDISTQRFHVERFSQRKPYSVQELIRIQVRNHRYKQGATIELSEVSEE